MTKTEFVQALTALRDTIQGTLDLAAKDATPVEPPAAGLPVVTPPDLADPEDQLDIIVQIDGAVMEIYNAVLEGRHGHGE
jgi:hypothetical protein